MSDLRVMVSPPMLWLMTDRGDQDVRRLVDGEGFGGKPHYSRQTPGDIRFTRNGQNLVFVTPCLRAAWITFRPTPGKAERKDRLEAWECALFRNESDLRASDLIREATLLTYVLWGAPPRDGLITFIRSDRVRPPRVRGEDVWGWTYLKAGWTEDGVSPKGYLRFKAPPAPAELPGLSEWRWKGARGGKMRRDLEAAGVALEAA